MTLKQCRTCPYEKDETEFYVVNKKTGKLNSSCKECCKKKAREYEQNNKEKVKIRKIKYREENKEIIAQKRRETYQENKENILEDRKEYQQNNKEKIAARKKEYRKENKESISIKRKQKYQENKENILEDRKEYYQDNRKDILNNVKDYQQNNREKINQRKKERYENDIRYKLRNIISGVINYGLKRNNSSKNGKSCINYLDYSLEELRIHLQNLFEPWMTWENWGVYNKDTWNDNDPLTWTWQLAHIIPHSKFKYISMEDKEFNNVGHCLI